MKKQLLSINIFSASLHTLVSDSVKNIVETTQVLHICWNFYYMYTLYRYMRYY